MLYLEDYLEMIENVPMEMRDRFTEMREMDLQVQNAMDSLDDQVKNFFKKCLAGQVKPEGKDESYDSIKQGYSKALEDADEKVQLANQIYDLVERYLRKLDQEVAKFKMELEADNAGITEILERRSLELDNPPPTHNNHKAEKRKQSTVMTSHLDKRTSTEKVLSSLATEAAREAIGAHRTSTGGTALAPSASVYTPTSASPQIYNLARVGGVGSNPAIQAAASRAIGATLEMSQGRRTSSLKASYDALTRGTDVTKDLAFPVEAARAAASAGTPPPSSEKSNSRIKKSSSRAQQQASAAAIPPPAPIVPPAEEVPVPTEYTEMVVDETTQGSTWSYDPNEPRYCICNDVSYGEMVGCDNEDCPIEWFHYGCVGLAQAPKGKWYCPQCTAAMRRRGRK